MVSSFLTCLKCSCLISITATLCTLSQSTDRGRSKLLFIDSDNLCYDVKKPDDLYRDFLQDLKYFVRLPKRRFPYSERDQKVLPIGEFIGLWSKMNTTAKGVPRTSLRHKDCKSCLFEKQMQIAQIRSENHQIYSLNLIKTSLSP